MQAWKTLLSGDRSAVAHKPLVARSNSGTVSTCAADSGDQHELPAVRPASCCCAARTIELSWPPADAGWERDGTRVRTLSLATKLRLRLSRPEWGSGARFGGLEIPGLRCAPTRAIESRPVGARTDAKARWRLGLVRRPLWVGATNAVLLLTRSVSEGLLEEDATLVPTLL